MKTITLRLEDSVKEALDDMVAEMGMNLTTFYTIYTMRALRDRRIPFDITAPQDPFYSNSNMQQLDKATEQVKNGNVVMKTLEELENLTNE